MPRSLAIVTTGRADYGILVPVLRAADAHPGLAPEVYATGAHLSRAHGHTIDRIEAGAWTIGARVHSEPVDSEGGPPGHPDTADDMPRKTARAVVGFAEAFIARRPDVCVLLGDRFETLAAAVAAATAGIPIAHLHGGEITTGAIDNQFRYAITALANLHCVATPLARERLLAMGEAPDTVVRTGAPGLDFVRSFEPAPREAFVRDAGLTGDDPFLLVTLHSTTIATDDPAEHAHALGTALESVGMPCLVTAANQDPGGVEINRVLRDASDRNGWRFVEALGPGLYHQAMNHASAMVGNSSSGIIEAASFGLPVVNIGDRQAGRERSGNVLDCPPEADAIERTIRDALKMDPKGLTNIYGDGDAGERIAAAIAGMPLGAGSLRKPFAPPALG